MQTDMNNFDPRFTVTLDALRKAGACYEGYNKLVRSIQGETFSAEDADRNSYIRFKHDADISLLDILKSNGLDDALWTLRCIPGADRDLRLFAVWCARQVEHMMEDQRSKDALNVAERFANGEATEEERAAAGDAARAAASPAKQPTAAPEPCAHNYVRSDAVCTERGEKTAAAPIDEPTIPDELHPDTAKLVRRFACALANKLLAAQRKYGYSDNWMRDDWADECRAELMRHIQKGDPRDVAAYCAFLWHHDESTAPAPADDRASNAGTLTAILKEYREGKRGLPTYAELAEIASRTDTCE